MYADGHDGHDDDDNSLKSHRELDENRWMDIVGGLSECVCVYCVCTDNKPFSKIYTNLLEKEITAGHNGDKTTQLTPHSLYPNVNNLNKSKAQILC